MTCGSIIHISWFSTFILFKVMSIIFLKSSEVGSPTPGKKWGAGTIERGAMSCHIRTKFSKNCCQKLTTHLRLFWGLLWPKSMNNFFTCLRRFATCASMKLVKRFTLTYIYLVTSPLCVLSLCVHAPSASPDESVAPGPSSSSRSFRPLCFWPRLFCLPGR